MAEQKADSRIKFIYFDVHQVLVDYFPDEMVAIMAQELDVSADIIEEHFTDYQDDITRGKLDNKKSEDILSQKLNLARIDLNAFYLQAVKPKLAIQKACQWAMAHCRTGLLANVLTGKIEILTNHSLIPDNFDVIVDSTKIGCKKPEREIYEYAQQQSKCDAAEICLVDDSVNNLKVAQACGWQTFYIDSKQTEEIVATELLKFFQTFIFKS